MSNVASGTEDVGGDFAPAGNPTPATAPPLDIGELQAEFQQKAAELPGAAFVREGDLPQRAEETPFDGALRAILERVTDNSTQRLEYGRNLIVVLAFQLIFADVIFM